MCEWQLWGLYGVEGRGLSGCKGDGVDSRSVTGGLDGKQDWVEYTPSIAFSEDDNYTPAPDAGQTRGEFGFEGWDWVAMTTVGSSVPHWRRSVVEFTTG